MKEQTKLPEAEDRIDFSTQPPMQPLMQPQQTILRVQPRESDEGPDKGLHWLLRSPTNSPGNVGRMGLMKGFPNAWNTDPHSSLRPEATNALAPVTEMDWVKRDHERRKKEEYGERGIFDRDSSRRRENGREDEAKDSSEISLNREILPFAHKEKLTPAQIERRAEFERLLNSSASVTVRKPTALEPVTSMEMPKQETSAAALPTIGGMRIDRGPIGPDAAFNARHDYLRGPQEESAKRYSSEQKKPNTYDPSAKPSLMRQPSVHEIPSRSF